MSDKKTYIKTYRTQQGVVLISALIFMILVTLLGLAVVSSTTSEEKMARNFSDRDVAYSAAEAALRDAKTHLTGAYRWPYVPVSLTIFDATCSAGFCDSIYNTPAASIDSIDFFSNSAPGSNSIVFGSATSAPAVSGVAAQPRYMIEAVRTNTVTTDGSPDIVYRITAQAEGRSTATRVVLQEIFRPTAKLN